MALRTTPAARQVGHPSKDIYCILILAKAKKPMFATVPTEQ